MEINSENWEKSVRLKVYDLLLSTGTMPTVQAVADALDRPINQVRTALTSLRQKKSIVLMPESGEILMAQPWTAVPTPFPVTVAKRQWYGTCIWDALAIPAALRDEGTVNTSCACCGEAMSLTVRDGRLLEGKGVVHIGLPANQWWDDPFFT